MKPLQYVKKYNLSTIGFREEIKDDFIFDFINDFNALIDSKIFFITDFTYKHFIDCINETRKKYESIENKTLGIIPASVWEFFYNTVVSKKQNEIFPSIAEEIQGVNKMNYETLKTYVDEYIDFYLKIKMRGYFGTYKQFKKKEIEKINKILNPVFHYALNLLISLEEEKDREYEERVREEYRRFYEEREKERQNFYNFFNKLFDREKNNLDKHYNTLQLKNNANVDEIKTAYRKLSLKYHPDKGGNQEDFIEITKAKNILLQALEK